MTWSAPWAFIWTDQPWGLSNSQSCLNRLFTERYQVVINPCAVWWVVWFSYLKRIGGERGLYTFYFELLLQKQSITFSLFFFPSCFLLGGVTSLKFNCQAVLALPCTMCVGCLSRSALGATRQRRGWTVFSSPSKKGKEIPELLRNANTICGCSSAFL